MNETPTPPPTHAAGSEPECDVAKENLVWERIFYGREVINRILETIQVKRAMQQHFLLRYTARAGMAGLIVCLMYVFTYQVKTDLGHDFNSGLSKYLTSLSFSMALVFIYFSNSELLTSNFMYFTVGRYYGAVTRADALWVLGVCLLGNLLGILGVAALVCSCGMMSQEVVLNLMATVEAKTIGSSAWLIFVKAIFANYFINVSVTVAMQLKEALAKMAVLMMGVTIFAYMGFEHVIANSALFIMALLAQPADVNLLHVAKNFVFSLLGNYVGGGLVIGLFYSYLNDHRRGRPSPSVTLK